MSERWALVVGGSGGIGAEIARGLGRVGWDVVLTYGRNVVAAESVASEVRGMGRAASVRQLSLPGGDPGVLDGLGALVFAAGHDIGQPYVSRTDPADLRRAVDVELHGFFGIAQAALPALRASQGSIVAVLSAGLGRFPPGDVLSVAPKAGVEAIVRGIAREEGKHGVRANAVGVGVVEAGIFKRIEWSEAQLSAMRRNTPLRRFARAEEVANAVVFLAGEQSSFVTGQTLFVDGGYTV